MNQPEMPEVLIETVKKLGVLLRMHGAPADAVKVTLDTIALAYHRGYAAGMLAAHEAAPPRVLP